MNMKFMAKPVYETVNVVAKTTETVTGTIDRQKVGRVLLTCDAGFTGAHEVVGGDNSSILTVQEIGEKEGCAAVPEVFVELVGGIRSLASYKFFNGYTAKNKENSDIIDVFTKDGTQVNNIIKTADRMCAQHPECDNRWKIVTSDGTRVFLRKIATDLTETGKIKG